MAFFPNFVRSVTEKLAPNRGASDLLAQSLAYVPEPEEEQSPIPEPEEPGAISRLREILSGQPSRDDYAPSFGRKLLAGLAGATHSLSDPRTGMGTADHILNANYRKAMDDYENRVKGAMDEVKAEELGWNRHMDAERVGLDRERLGETQRYHNTQAEIGKTRNNNFSARTQAMIDDQKRREERDKARDENADLDRAQRRYDQSVMAGVAGRNAATAEERARIARLEYERRKNNPPGSKPPQPKHISPQAQASAEEGAAQEAIAENPHWAKFIDEKGNIKPSPVEQDGLFSREANVKARNQANADDFRAFRKRIDELKQKRLNVFVDVPVDDESVLDDDDDEVMDY